jgi:hypothetical protein
MSPSSRIMIENITGGTPERIEFPEISTELLRMVEIDQEMRAKEIDEPDSWDESVDMQNTARMHEIVNQVGWPSISKVGAAASSAAWLLVQHADHDVEFQKHCLSLMKQEAGDVARHDIAYLEDRTRVNEGRPQLYGTQFNNVEGAFVSRDMEDPAQVDERRRQMGLPTLAENLEEMYQKYRLQKPE